MSRTALLRCLAAALAAAVLLAPPSQAGASGNWIDLDATTDGYKFRGASRFGSHLVITHEEGRLLFVDSNAGELLGVPAGCEQVEVAAGLGISCPVPEELSAADPLTIEVLPRLGDDYVDSSSLGAQFRLYVLADAGNDTVRLGAGRDFVNGALGDDRVWGGGGHDWIRTGPGDDLIYGQGGPDRLVGAEESDEIHGGMGSDTVDGGPGADWLWTGDGRDLARCGGGLDHADVDERDRHTECEVVT
jgi:serralysin